MEEHLYGAITLVKSTGPMKGRLWKHFKKYFNQKYLSDRYYDDKIKEFQEMKLKEMTMDEYVSMLSILEMIRSNLMFSD